MLIAVGRCFLGALVLCSMTQVGWAQGPTTEPLPHAPTATDASSVAYAVDGTSVVAVQGGVSTKLAGVGAVTGIHHAGPRLYVARGSAGVAVYDVTEPLVPKLEREQSTNGAIATGFVSIDGLVWVLVTAKSALPVDASRIEGPAPVAAAVPSSAPTAGTVLPRPVKANIVEIRLVSPGMIEIAQGTNQGAKVTDKFTLLRPEEREGANRERFLGERVVGTAEVVAVREDSSLAEVSRSAVVRPYDRARTSKPKDEEESNVFPARVPNVGEFGIVLRPLLNIGRPLGVGVLADLEATYWGSAYFAGATVQPLGIGTTADGSVVSIAALAEGGYDGPAFAAGLGAGIGWVNGDVDSMLLVSKSASDMSGSSSPQTVSKQKTNGVFAVSQVVRLGARDGLRLQLRNIMLLHRDTYSNERGFIYGGTSGKFVVPTGRRADMFFEGGGGVMGYWFVGLGVGTWLIGNGSPGSLHLSVSAGAAGIFGSREVTSTYQDSSLAGATSYTYTSRENLNIAGPMVSVGITRRFEL